MARINALPVAQLVVPRAIIISCANPLVMATGRSLVLTIPYRSERYFDSALWRAGERAYQTAIRARLRARQRVREWRAPNSTQVINANQSRPSSRRGKSDHPVTKPLQAISALRFALTGGGYDTALTLVDEIRPQLPALTAAARTAALPLIVETLLAHGKREEAAAIAADYQSELFATPGGAGLFETLRPRSEGTRPRLVLKSGYINTVGVCRELDREALRPEKLIDLLLTHPVAVLREPQLHLLVHRAYLRREPPRALAALNRYLRAMRLGSCRVGGPGAWGLFDLVFDQPPAVHGGPLVSVLMAAYNAQRSILPAVDSILQQSHRNLELLVCDDGSGDATPAMLQERARTDARMRVYSSRANQGPYNIRNLLLAEARGDVIAYQDADDVALPRRIELQLRALERADAPLSYTSWIRMLPDGRIIFFRDQSAQRLCLISLMARRSTLDELGGFRPARFAADYEFFQAARARYGDSRIARLRVPLVFGLWAESSVTKRAGSEATEDGYRSAARRHYSELVFQRYLQPTRHVTSEHFDRLLRETDNLRSPQGIAEI